MPKDEGTPYVRRVETSKIKWSEIRIPFAHLYKEDKGRHLLELSLSLHSKRLLVTSYNKPLLSVCDTDGNVIQQVNLPANVQILRAVESRRKTFIVCFINISWSDHLMVGEFDESGGPSTYLYTCADIQMTNISYCRLVLGPENTVFITGSRSADGSDIIKVLNDHLKLARVETFALRPDLLK